MRGLQIGDLEVRHHRPPKREKEREGESESGGRQPSTTALAKERARERQIEAERQQAHRLEIATKKRAMHMSLFDIPFGYGRWAIPANCPWAFLRFQRCIVRLFASGAVVFAKDRSCRYTRGGHGD